MMLVIHSLREWNFDNALLRIEPCELQLSYKMLDYWKENFALKGGMGEGGGSGIFRNRGLPKKRGLFLKCGVLSSVRTMTSPWLHLQIQLATLNLFKLLALQCIVSPKIVKFTLQTLQHLLQDFWCVYDHFVDIGAKMKTSQVLWK